MTIIFCMLIIMTSPTSEEECEMCGAKGELHFANTMHWCEECLRSWIDERISTESKTKDEDMYDYLVGDGCEYVVDEWFANEINSVKVISEWWSSINNIL